MKHVTLVVSTVIDLIPPRVAKWLGLVLILAAWILPRVIAMAGSDVDGLDTLYLVGAGLLLAAKPTVTLTPAPVVEAPRGYSHIGALVLLAAASLIAALLSGCAAFQRREVHTQTAPVVVTDDTSGRCITRGYGDGHELLTIIGPVGTLCPEVEVIHALVTP